MKEKTPLVLINRNYEELTIYIETERLIIQSLMERDLPDYLSLLTNEVIMKKYGRGVQSEKQIQETFHLMLERWKIKYPYGRYSIFNRETGEFIGCFTLWDPEPGIIEPAIILKSTHWGNGYATEVATAMRTFIPKLIENGFVLVKGELLKKIIATAREDNPGSWNILKKDFSYEGNKEKFGSDRRFYSINMDDSYYFFRQNSHSNEENLGSLLTPKL